MGVDVKIDVIYFCEESDLKMEFGLHGRYPLRLLSNKATDEKSFITALKKAVQRSEIIITVGGFLGEKNLPLLIAKAVSREPKEVDYEKFKIKKTGRRIFLPRGAFPIVDSYGILLGCVIESGPQSIIMLSEDDIERTRLLSNIIVPYIEEHYKTYNLHGQDASQAVESPCEEVEQEATEDEYTQAVEETAEPPVVVPETAVTEEVTVESEPVDKVEEAAEPISSVEEREQPLAKEQLDFVDIYQTQDFYEDDTEDERDDFGYGGFVHQDDEYEPERGIGVAAKVSIAVGLVVVYAAISAGAYYLWNFLF